MDDSGFERRGGPGGWRRQTLAVRGGTMRSQFEETSEAIFATSGFVYSSAAEAEAAFATDTDRFVYSRLGNPTVRMLEERLALLEGAEAARATATGMAAVFAALMSQLKAGDRVVASRALFGSCHYIIAELLPRFGVETVLVDGTDLDAWAAALRRPTRTVFLESPSNPTLEVVDINTVAALAHGAGATVIVDNVFATPVLQKPLQLGADIVVYSTTKHIDGQGRCLGGVVLGGAAFVKETLTPFLKHTGPAMSPFNAWVNLKGVETLDLRVQQMCRNAATVAGWLRQEAKLARVIFPGFADHPQAELIARQMAGPGNLVGFSLAGGKAGAFAFMDALELIDISNNLGDAKSLITHPATTTHQRLKPEERAAIGIDDGYVRLSVGLEDPLDVICDLERAISAARVA